MFAYVYLWSKLHSISWPTPVQLYPAAHQMAIYLYDFASVCLNLIWLSIGVRIIRDFLQTFFSICCQQAALQVFGREIQHPSFAVKESGGATQMMRPREFVQSWVCYKHYPYFWAGTSYKYFFSHLRYPPSLWLRTECEFCDVRRSIDMSAAS